MRRANLDPLHVARATATKYSPLLSNATFLLKMKNKTEARSMLIDRQWRQPFPGPQGPCGGPATRAEGSAGIPPSTKKSLFPLLVLSPSKLQRPCKARNYPPTDWERRQGNRKASPDGQLDLTPHSCTNGNPGGGGGQASQPRTCVL